MENTPNNPLNTGNGMPGASSVNPTPASTPSSTPAPSTPTPIIPKPTLPNSPIPAPTTPGFDLEKIAKIKKYIIAGVAVVALLVTAYMAYGYFTGISSAVDEVKGEAVKLNNSLSAPADTSTTTQDTEDKAKLNNVVNELKDQYKTDTPTTDTTPATDTTTPADSTPPGMTIDLTPTTDDSSATPTDGVQR